MCIGLAWPCAPMHCLCAMNVQRSMLNSTMATYIRDRELLHTSLWINCVGISVYIHACMHACRAITRMRRQNKNRMVENKGTEIPITIITMGRCASHENYILRFEFFCDSDFIFFAFSFHFSFLLLSSFIWKHWLHSASLVSCSFRYLLNTYQSWFLASYSTCARFTVLPLKSLFSF